MSATEALPAYYGAYGARLLRTVTPVGRTLLSSTGGYGSYGAYGARRLQTVTPLGRTLLGYGSYGAYGARRLQTATPVGRTLLSSTGGYGSYGAYGARRLRTITPMGRTLLSSTGGYGSYGAYGSVRNCMVLVVNAMHEHSKPGPRAFCLCDVQQPVDQCCGTCPASCFALHSPGIS